MRKRLDEVLVERGMVETRARARGLILRGHVSVSGQQAGKAGLLVAPGAGIAIDSAADLYVSFGGDKLALAFDAFGKLFDPAGRTALDIGASTGGFTHVLLSRGARRVYAVDVGRSQLHPKLAADPRVISREGLDARSLTLADVPEPVDALVADVSFVSLTKVLGRPLMFTAPGAWMIVLVKPQFEAGPGAVGKGGIVRNKIDREAAIETVRSWISSQPGWTVTGMAPSPGLPGRSNEEYLLGAIRHG